MPRPTLAIIGAGALGTLFAAYLHPHAEVTMITRWRAQADKIAAHGLRLVEPDGSARRVPVRVTLLPETVAHTADIALVLVKTFDTGYAAQVAQTVLKPAGVAITLQNGLGNVETLAATLGEARAVAGVTTQGATLMGVGAVKNTHASMGEVQLAVHPAAMQVEWVLTAAGFAVSVVDNLAAVLWGKLVINVGINALTAILGQPNVFLAETESARAVLAAAVGEAVAVARAQNIPLPYADPVARVVSVARATGQTRSSMLSDVTRRSRTEIDAINGAVVRLGAELGVPTPVNETLMQLIHAIEKSYGAR